MNRKAVMKKLFVMVLAIVLMALTAIIRYRTRLYEGIMDEVRVDYPDATSFRHFIALAWRDEMHPDSGAIKISVTTKVTLVAATLYGWMALVEIGWWPYVFTAICLTPGVLLLGWVTLWLLTSAVRTSRAAEAKATRSHGITVQEERDSYYWAMIQQRTDEYELITADPSWFTPKALDWDDHLDDREQDWDPCSEEGWF